MNKILLNILIISSSLLATENINKPIETLETLKICKFNNKYIEIYIENTSTCEEEIKLVCEIGTNQLKKLNTININKPNGCDYGMKYIHNIPFNK